MMNKNNLLGMTYISPLGEMLIISDQQSVIGIYFIDQKYFKYHIETPIIMIDNPLCEDVIRWLDEYFKGGNPDLNNLKLNFNGTIFQKDVWQELSNIPYGQTTTYGRIAKTLALKYGKTKMSSRAVGSAISKNPLSIVIPCHRVIASDGKLTGYAGGIERKRWLLKFEEEHTHKN